VQLALGRIYMLLSRPFQEGDIEQYEAARAVVLAYTTGDMPPDYRPNYARHYNKGST
jgi:hypothetical protein